MNDDFDEGKKSEFTKNLNNPTDEANSTATNTVAERAGMWNPSGHAAPAPSSQ